MNTLTPRQCIADAVVESNVAVCEGHWRFVLRTEDFPECRPGQFINILCRDRETGDRAVRGPVTDPFLRRPFSLAELSREGRTARIEILHHVIGPGTVWLAARRPGDRVNILGPLGQPFRVDPATRRVTLVAGGIGIPPLLWLARTLAEVRVSSVLLYGVRSANALPLAVEREAVNRGRSVTPTPSVIELRRVAVPVLLCTDDGSLGWPGLVTEALAAMWAEQPPDAATCVFTCGPEAMMRRVAELCAARGVSCQACLERVMGCGLGTCQSCVVKVRDPGSARGWRYQLCCTDGPVFDASNVIW